ncbi:translation initiation factor eIF2B subunit alpha-like [Rhopilema esculentum]|uniref:translation initiation factor eIF2B subunit alpha-like n=1 Tax=Rhopilema esculentum TaxID=499914 RepID=UPI0031D9FDE4
MDAQESLQFFQKCVADDPEISVTVAAIRTLLEVLKKTEAETLAGLRDNIQNVVSRLTTIEDSVTSVSSGCELFLRFVTLASLDQSDFKECKRILVDRGELFLKKAAGSRKRIAKLSGQFIRDGATILTHSKSRGVLQLLKEAVDQNKRFQVYVTESMPDMSGNLMHKELQDLGIPSTVILDSAVGYIMERVDMVLVGAEGVGESGGLINKVGTYQLAVMAKAMSKPVYAVAESFKFQRIYPLNQKEVPNKHKYCNTTETGHPLVDYTPPSYITLLFTDLGVLTPSAVSDELINLYC